MRCFALRQTECVRCCEVSGPIFFEMGGEGAVNGIGMCLLCSDRKHSVAALHVVGNSYLMSLARQRKAMVVAIEHRFCRNFAPVCCGCFHALYPFSDGESVPLNSLEVSALQFLTVEQALKDAAVLIEYLQTQVRTAQWRLFGFYCMFIVAADGQLPIDYNVTHLRAPNAKYKVFAFGGLVALFLFFALRCVVRRAVLRSVTDCFPWCTFSSYSGALSAWFRVAYPQHTG